MSDDNYKLCRGMVMLLLTGKISAQQLSLLARSRSGTAAACAGACPAAEAMLQLAARLPPGFMIGTAGAKNHMLADNLVVPLMTSFLRALVGNLHGKADPTRKRPERRLSIDK